MSTGVVMPAKRTFSGWRWDRVLLVAVAAIGPAGFVWPHQLRAEDPSSTVAAPEPETGIASWYGHPFHGRRAADGEIYDMAKLTAAHRTLPFDTRVRVVNLTNDKSVEVRINDRGPFVDGRIIDLSMAAAQAIEMIGPGISPVRVEVIEAPTAVAPDLFAVQVGAFQELDNAKRYLKEMRSRYGHARLSMREGDPVLWRVLVGAQPTQASARALANRIRQDFSEKTPFVTRIDP